MKLIKTASLDDKLNRAGNPTEPLLIQVCRLDDVKNLLDWNKITVRQGGKEALIREIDRFVNSGKAKKIFDSQVGKSKSRFEKALVFDRNKDPRALEITYQRREALEKGLSNISKWEELLFGGERGNYGKSNTFLYIAIALNMASNPSLSPSKVALEKYFSNLNQDKLSEYTQVLTNDRKMLEYLGGFGIEERDVHNPISLMKKTKGIVGDLGKRIGNIKRLMKQMVGYDPTTGDPTQEQKQKENYIDINTLDEEDKEILDGLIHESHEKRTERDFLNGILKEITNRRSKGESQLANLYDDIQSKEDLGDEESSNVASAVNNANGWIFIPHGRVPRDAVYSEDIRSLYPNIDFSKFDLRSAFLSSLTKGTGWCITQATTAMDYINRGDFMIYVEGNTPRVCIRYNGSDSVLEFTGMNNRPVNIAPYADQVFALCDKYPKIKNDLTNFRGETHHSSLKQLDIDAEKLKEFEGLPLEEINTKLREDSELQWGAGDWGRRVSLDYLSDQKINFIYSKNKNNKVISDDEYEKYISFVENLDLCNNGQIPKIIEDCDKIEEDFFKWLEKNELTAKEAAAISFNRTVKKFWMKAPSVEKDTLAGRFVHLKTDPEVQSEVIRLIKEELEYIEYQHDNKGMHAINLSRLNNQFGQIAVKDPIVQECAIQALLSMSKFEGEDSKKGSLFDDVSTIIKKSGAYSLFKDIAQRKAINKMVSGDVEGAMEIGIQFDLELDEELDEETFKEYWNSAVDLYVNDKDAFEKLDKMFGGRFSKPESLEKIKKEASPKIEDRVVELVNGFRNAKNYLDLSNFLEEFPDLLKSARVLNRAIKMSSDLILDEPEKFKKLDIIFNFELTKGTSYEIILNSVKPKVLDKALNHLQNSNILQFKELLERFPYIGDHHQVIGKSVLLTAGFLSRGEFKEASSLVKLIGFGNYDMDLIYEKVFEILRPEIESAMSRGDIKTLYSYDLRTGRKTKKENGKNVLVSTGLVLGDKRQEIIDSSKDLALTYIMSEILGQKTISEESIKNFESINSIYNNEFYNNDNVKSRLKSIYLRYKNINNEESHKICAQIESIYGKGFVSESDININRQKLVKNYAKIAEQVLEREEFTKLVAIFTKFPELKNHRGLLSVSIQFTWNCARDVHLEDYNRVSEKKKNIETLNGLFNGALLGASMGNQAYQKIVARERELQAGANQNVQEALTENI